MSAIYSNGWQNAMWKSKKPGHFRKIPIRQPVDKAPRAVPKIRKPNDEEDDGRKKPKSETKLYKMLRGGKKKKPTSKPS